jgi:hypothetical protein
MPFGITPGLTLGQLIESLKDCDYSAVVYFDFGDVMMPTKLQGLREGCSELAIGYATAAESPYYTVAEFINYLEGWVGQVYEWYKGFDGMSNYGFCCYENTPVWVDNWGDWSERYILDVTDSANSGEVIIRTNKEENNYLEDDEMENVKNAEPNAMFRFKEYKTTVTVLEELLNTQSMSSPTGSDIASDNLRSVIKYVRSKAEKMAFELL